MDVVLHPQLRREPLGVPRVSQAGRPADKEGAQAGATTLARGTWNGSALVDVHDIFESHTTETEASRIAFGRDGMIYMSISAPGSGPDVGRAQDPDDYAGKVVRLRDDGTVPPDDPYVTRAGTSRRVYTTGIATAMGSRSIPKRATSGRPSRDPTAATRSTSSGREELRLAARQLRPRLLGTPYPKRPTREGLEDPLVVWLPSIGLTGMTFYTGDRFPHWKRNVFVAGLREGGIPRTGQIQRIAFNERWEELRREPMLMDLHQRIRDIRQGPDGLLYILTAENDGALLRLEPRDSH